MPFISAKHFYNQKGIAILPVLIVIILKLFSQIKTPVIAAPHLSGDDDKPSVIRGYFFMKKETWKPIVGWEERYMISSHGRVKRVARMITYTRGNGTVETQPIKEQLTCVYFNGSAYAKVNLSKNRIIYHKYAHRLVAEAFVPNPNNFPEVNHKDGNKLNNHYENLEWCTRNYNIQHSYDIGIRRYKPKYGIEHPSSKPVTQMTLDGNAIREFVNILEAAKVTGISKQTIITHCKTTVRNPRKFLWKYKK